MTRFLAAEDGTRSALIPATLTRGLVSEEPPQVMERPCLNTPVTSQAWVNRPSSPAMRVKIPIHSQRTRFHKTMPILEWSH